MRCSVEAHSVLGMLLLDLLGCNVQERNGLTGLEISLTEVQVIRHCVGLSRVSEEKKQVKHEISYLGLLSIVGVILVNGQVGE